MSGSWTDCLQVKVVFVKYPDECCPHGCARHARCCSEWLDGTLAGRAWWAVRCAMYRLIENKYFETFIILMICASSLSLVGRLNTRTCQLLLPAIFFGSRPSDHYFRSVCLSVCLFVQSFSQPCLIRFRSN